MFRIISLVLLLNFSTLTVSASDIGGGGVFRQLQRELQLDDQVAQLIRSQDTESAAFQAWLRNLTPQQRNQVMQILFKGVVLPQIE